MKKVLITGGAGFIGSHLAEYLLNKGHSVRVLDNFSTGQRSNIDGIVEHPSFELVEGDIMDAEVVHRSFDSVDQVYHLAASVGVKYIMNNLVNCIHNNVVGTEVVLEAAKQANCRVLITSTSEVYGKSSEKPSKENDDLRMGETIKSRWSYACSKALNEYLAFSYFHEQQLPVTVVRLFNTVGERQSDAYGMVVPTFVRQALKNEPVTIYGDGQQSRCFGYVQDVVWALYRLMEHPDAIGQVYNIGSTEIVSIEELADRVIAITDSNSRKEFIPYENAYAEGFDDAARRVPDTTKISQLIGFEPKHALDDIIKKVAADISVQ